MRQRGCFLAVTGCLACVKKCYLIKVKESNKMYQNILMEKLVSKRGHDLKSYKKYFYFLLSRLFSTLETWFWLHSQRKLTCQIYTSVIIKAHLISRAHLMTNEITEWTLVGLLEAQVFMALLTNLSVHHVNLSSVERKPHWNIIYLSPKPILASPQCTCGLDCFSACNAIFPNHLWCCFDVAMNPGSAYFAASFE